MKLRACLCVLVLVCLYAGSVSAAEGVAATAPEDDSLYDPFDKTEPGAAADAIADPLETFNRGMFVFNDKLYFWVLKPAARGYGYVVPEPARTCVKRLFGNLATPVRLVNCLLQGKFKGAGSELTRFVVNSTAGVGGLFDPAYYCWDLKRYEEDTGRTFGRYGVGHGVYIVWPFIGPSSARDTVGLVGDVFLDPLTYVNMNMFERAGIKAYQRVNQVSLNINQYDDFKKGAIDPYVSLRAGYVQYRRHDLK